MQPGARAALATLPCSLAAAASHRSAAEAAHAGNVEQSAAAQAVLQSMTHSKVQLTFILGWCSLSSWGSIMRW